MSSKTNPITNMASAAPPSEVDPTKFYRVALQMGAGYSWRNMSGRKRQAKLDPASGKTLLHHDPKIHEDVGPLNGKEVNGLIQAHKEWLAAYQQRDTNSWQGHLDQQILVLSIAQTTELPAKEKKALSGSVDVIGLLESLVTRAINQKPAAKS